MRRIIIVLCMVLSAFVASAQPEIYLENATADPGEQVCVPVRGRFFTDIVTIQFSVNFDADKLDFVSVGNFGIGDMTNANFDVSQTSEGIVTFSWRDAARDCQSTNGGTPSFTLENNEILFEICFEAKANAGYGEIANINISDDPLPIVIERLNTFDQFGCKNLFFINIIPGLVSIGVRPVEIEISEESGNTGDLVCVNFAAKGFDNLQSMQFSVGWDSTVMTIENVVANGDIPNNGPGNFGFGGNVAANRLTYNWFYLVPDQPGITLDDGTQLFQACFRINADACDKSSEVTILGTPTQIEVTNQDVEGQNLYFESQAGEVQVNDCDPVGVEVRVDCGAPVNIDEQICVPIRAGENFNRVSTLEFLLKWNPSVLEFKEVRNLAQSWTSGDFDDANAMNGILGVAWANSPFPPLTLNPDDIIFEVCFDVVGLGGNSPVNINSPWKGRLGNNPFIGVNPTNCEVVVNQPDGITLSISDGAAGPGDSFCMDFNASSFEDITSMEFSLAFDPGLFAVAGVEQITLEGASAANFNTSGAPSGSIFFDWDAPSGPVTVADGTSLFRLCFNAIGSPGDCGELIGTNIPLDLEATNATSNGENIGLTITAGEMCTLFPEGFGLNIEDTEGDWLDTTCVKVSVVEFDDISATNYCISWDATAMEYTGINLLGAWPGLTETNVDASSANVGLLCINWDNGDTPVSIPDDTDVFELCFKLIGEALTCHDITLAETTEATVTTAAGPGSIVPQDGSLCINDKFYIVDTLITPASCAGVCDGKIEISIIGGQGQVGTIWFTEPQNQFTPLMAENLCPGPVNFRLADSNTPSLFEDFTLEVPLSGELPVANAGDDALLGCNPQSILLSGSGSEGDFTYEWFRLTNSGTQVPIGTGRSVVEFTAGQKIFRVTDNNSGCSAQDTVLITAPELPVAEAGNDINFVCSDDGIQLNGAGSSTGNNIVYTWSTSNGVIAAGQETLLNPIIEAPGTYQLRVAFADNGCFSTDTVRVEDVRNFPNAVAGEDQVLECATGTVNLSAAGSDNTGFDVTYEWYDENEQLLSTGQNFTADQLGTYILIARDDFTNCTAQDSVRVVPDENFPDVSIAQPLDFTCIRDTVALTATVGPEDIDYTFNWAATNGGQLAPGSDTTLSPTVLSPGTFLLSVTNTASGCTAEIDVVVKEDTAPPTVEAGTDQTLTCTITTRTLSGAGSDAGEGFAYLWTNSAGDTIGTTLTLDVNSPDTYTLEITNQETGCTATDNVTVNLDGDVPQVAILDKQDLSCDVSSVELTASVSPAGMDFLYEWALLIGDDGLQPVGDGTSTLTVTEAGTYQVTATNPEDGCAGTTQVVIGLNDTAPVADAGPAVQTLTCDTASVTLSAAASSQGPEFTYEWSGLPAPDNANTMVVVTQPDTYVLTVRNTQNGCTATAEVEVIDGQQLPELTIDSANDIDCVNPSATLSASVSGASDITVNWISVDGGMPSPADELTTNVDIAGTYRLVVENNLTGCRDSIEVNVADNSGDPPQVLIAQPSLFTCTTPTITLDATATGSAASFSSINWASLDGNTVTPASGSLTVNVDGPGQYTLTLVDALTGCTGVDTVTVVPDNDTPVAMAGPDISINCGETGLLDGTASSQGTQFTYLWVNIDAGNSPSPADDIEVAVEEAATYTLIVTNTQNGCIDTDTVVVSRNFPEMAAAGTDVSLCQDETTTLSANLPTGTTGVWSSNGSAALTSPNEITTEVSGLQAGANTFTWTLSAPGCPDYSSDMVTVYIETAPTPVEDVLIIDGDDRSVTIDLAQNDILTNIDNYSVTLQGEPEFGTIDSVNNGRLRYSVQRGFVGTTQISYEICNMACPDLCATGTLRINVSDDDFEPTIMNTMTPNGDGMNDNLVFDLLLFTPAEEFPDNEIIVFNRWGDIVFQQRPYTNDWDGTNNDGEPLPHGTYYYILRLNLADGVIIRGDVTIVK